MANADDLVARSGGKPIRSASKSIRCREVLRRVLDRSPVFQGVLCFGAGEAAHLAAHDFDDLVVAYPTVDAHDIAAVCQQVARFVNGGNTGSRESTRDDEVVTELAAGSGLYGPVLFDGYQRFKLRPAAGFALPVVRRPVPGIYTCFGGGWIAPGAAGPDRLPRPYLPASARLLATEGAGEVQTPIALPGPETLELGDPVLFRHAKAGELCEHVHELLLLLGPDGGRERVPTYRGDGFAFV